MANNYVHLAMEETPRYEGAAGTTPYRVSTTGVFFPTTAARVNANPSYVDRGQELRNIMGDVPLLIESFAPDGSIAERAYVNHLAYLLSVAGLKATITVGDGANATWTLTFGGTPASGGTFTITTPQGTTAGIPFNATAAQVQAALEAITGIGVGNVLVVQTSGGPLPAAGVMTVTFRRALGGTIVTPVTAAAGGLTGGAPTITPASTISGAPATVTSPDFVTGDTFATKPNSFVGLGAFKYVFSKRTGAQAQTAQITAAYGDMGVWLRGQGFGVSELSLNAAGEMTANLLGLVCASIADPALSPTYDSQSVLPVRRGDLTLTWLSGGGTIDDFTLSLANPLQAVHSLGLATPSFFPDIMEQSDDQVKISGTIPKRRFNATDFAALLAGTTFSATARWRTPGYVADSPSKYGLWIVMPACQLNAGTPDELYSRRRFGASYNWWAAYDETAGYDFQVVLVCGVSAASLSSPSFSV